MGVRQKITEFQQGIGKTKMEIPQGKKKDALIFCLNIIILSGLKSDILKDTIMVIEDNSHSSKT